MSTSSTDNYACIRVTALRSSDHNTFSKKGLVGSAQHNLRLGQPEKHVDYSKTHENIVLGVQNLNEIFEHINYTKMKYGLAQHNSTIDLCEMLFSINGDYFKANPEREIIFCETIASFLKNEYGDLYDDAAVSLQGHKDETAFHVHVYMVPIAKTTRNKKEITRINYNELYGTSGKGKNRRYGDIKLSALQDRWYEHLVKVFPDIKRGHPADKTKKKHIPPKEFRELKAQEAQLKMEIDKLEQKKIKLSQEVKYMENTSAQTRESYIKRAIALQYQPINNAANKGQQYEHSANQQQ